MGKKILILNGSPRPNGNTSALIGAFAAGAQFAGHTVTTFLLDQMNIHGCKGCWQGGKDPDHPCVQRDDMEKIYPAYREANVVVLASPLYYWNLSGQLRTAFDRLFAVAECDNYCNPQKEAALLMVAEGNGFEEAAYYYTNLMQHMSWKDLGQVLVGGVTQPGDILGNPGLEKAFQLGASIQ